ncbi:MAG: GNAT family N-acetyltransferase [Cryomorphaceae bacterium]|nr:GNAT family N-acetyltransferase [Cryomorphaceae bacterium]
MTLLRDHQIDTKAWLQLLDESPNASPFQSPAYYKLFTESKGFSANVFALEQDGALQALVVVSIQKEPGVKAAFSKRGIIYGGPLFTDQDSALQLISEVSRYYKGKLIYLETRNFSDYTEYKRTFESSGWKYEPWLNYHLPCDEAALVQKRMSSSRWRQIKKALKNGATWKESHQLEEVQAFYSILEVLYKEKIKKPLLPFSFFQDLLERDLAKYLLVYVEGKVVGGIVCPVLPGRKIFEFYVCGLDGDYRDHYPSVMATYAAIEYALQNNIPLFDFMGAGSPDEAYGVREFKSRFGGEEVEHGRFIKILNPAMFEIGKAGLKLLAKVKK